MEVGFICRKKGANILELTIMDRINSVLLITPNYPIAGDPVYPFVKNLCDEFAKSNINVTVVSPQSVTSSWLHRKKLRPRIRTEYIEGKEITIYQPYSLTPKQKHLKAYNYFIRLSVLWFLKRRRLNFDVCYCHFWCSAYWVIPYMKQHNIPLFVASGESVIKTQLSTHKRYSDFNKYVKGVVCVSSKNKEESISLNYTTEDKCIVLPNAINAKLFFKRSREYCRKELGYPQDAFIVAFVGWFIDRKGPIRVAKAIEAVGGVKSLFIGKGNQDPQCDGILFKGQLSHDKIPIYLGAADCFVMPTRHEGCCNAVIEAMACGLPIISSNLPFNWDVLDSTNSIMVDPNNINEIASAIRDLKDNPEKRLELANGALRKANSLNIDKRVKSIIEFMESKI